MDLHFDQLMIRGSIVGALVAAVGVLWLFRRRWQALVAFTLRVPPPAANEVALIRILVFGVLFCNALWEDLPSVAFIPKELRVEMGLMRLLHFIPGWSWLYAHHDALLVFKIATCALLAAATIGFWQRWTIPLATLLAILYGGLLREQSHFFHSMTAALYLALILTIMPRGKIPSAANDAKIRYTCWIVLAGVYLSAGLSKLVNGGLWWWQGSNIKTIVALNNLNVPHFDFGLQPFLLALPVWCYAVLGFLTLVIELAYPLILVSQRARVVLPIAAVFMHLGIFLSQGILFLDLIVLQGIFFVVPLQQQTSDSTHSRPGRAAILVAVGCLAAWLFGVEFYPFTSWQMYSHDLSAKQIIYWKMRVTHADGTESELRPDTLIPALTDCRYRDHFMAGENSTRLFFRALSIRANALTLEPGKSWKEVRLETWAHAFDAAQDLSGDREVARIVEPVLRD